MRKSQSAMEFLMTYGWAFLLIIVIVGALFYMGVFNPSADKSARTEMSFGATEIGILDHKLSNDGAWAIEVANRGIRSKVIKKVIINGTAFSFDKQVAPGKEVYLAGNHSSLAGEGEYDFNMTIIYLSSSGLEHRTTGNFAGHYEYSNSTQTIYSWFIGTQADFDEGTYINTTYGSVMLAGSNPTGRYVSKVFDAGDEISWDNMSWGVQGLYSFPLPSDNSNDGDADMRGNVMLHHMDERAPVNEVTGHNYGFAFRNARTQADSGGPRMSREALFDGKYDYVETLSDRIPIGDSPRSLSVWINPNIPPSDYDAIVSWGGSASVNNNLFELLIDQEGRVFFHNWGSLSDPIGVAKSGDWHHIVVTYNGSAVKGYFDGVHTMTSYVRLETDSSKVYIGKSAHNAESNYRNYGGLIDEVAIYSTELSPFYVSMLYNHGLGYSHSGGENGLISAWHFDEESWTHGYPEISDYSGNANLGLIQNDVRYGRKGVFNTSLYFNGNNGYVGVKNDGLLDIRGDRMTIEAWVNWNEMVPITLHSSSIIDKNGDDEWQLFHTYNNDRFSFMVVTEKGRANVDSATTIKKGEWYHVAGVYNSTHLLIYVNGKLENATSIDGDILATHSSINIGRNTEDKNYFNGRIDEIAVYNRSLSAEEILRHYRRGVLELNASVRSCDDASCSGESWGSPLKYPFAELDIPDNRYFQFMFNFSTKNTEFSPILYNVSINR